MTDLNSEQRKKLIFYSLAHSGGHPIVDWLLRNFNHGKKVEISLSVNQVLTNLKRDLFFYHQVDPKSEDLPKSPYETERVKTLVYHLSDQSIKPVSPKDEIKTYQIVILRDPLNLVASRQKLGIHFIDQKMIDLWIEQANFVMAAIQEARDQAQAKNSKNLNSNYPEKVFILYNRWVIDKDYRDSICQHLGIKNYDHTSSVSHLGQGSSFSGFQIEKDPTEYLKRFQQINWNPELVQLLKNNQLIQLSTKLFSKIPILSKLTNQTSQLKIAEPEPEPEPQETKLEPQEIKLEPQEIKLEPQEIKLEPPQQETKSISHESPPHPDATKPPDILPNVSRITKRVGYKTLGISMIVKNEEAIITNCLKSIVDHLDYWVIHDTGSIDRTPEIILDFFREHGVPGELHYMPWKNFGWNRTQAINMAKLKTNYVMLLDADFIVHIKQPDFKSQLTSSGYLIRYLGGLDYRQILLVDCQYDWQYYGVTHEYIDTKPDQHPVEITELLNMEHTGEGSNRSEKFKRDVELLTQGLIDEPENARYYFYLAQSYKDWGKYDEAIEAYQKRIDFGKWDEEVFYSYYQIGMCRKRRGDDFYQYVGTFLKAHNNRRQRIEPLYQILEDCAYDEEKALVGYRIGMMNSEVKYPIHDLLFIEKPLYDWMYLDMLATCAHTAGLVWEALEITERIVREKKYGQHQAQRFENNLRSLRELVMQDQGGDQSSGQTKPFNFIRIAPENHYQRVAVIIANYNMPERANQIVRTIKNLDGSTSRPHPTDLILVDNGSDLVPPSRFTAVFLGKNVQTTHAWLAGLHYADSLEETEGFKYFAYVFVITSAEIPQPYLPGRGLIQPMAAALARNENLVGTHPALTVDSTTHWKQLIIQTPPKMRPTNMLDNIFSMYRADWFNSIGRFDPKLTYAWGIDLETSYLARKDGKQLVVLDGLLVRKISNIGYKMNRMGMRSEDRLRLASQQMNQRMVEKYGNNWGQIFNQNSIEEGDRSDYYEINCQRLHQIMLNFEKIEAAHSLLMNYLFRNHMLYYGAKEPPILLEIGATVDEYPHLDSTRKMCRMASVYGYRFISVDQNAEVTERNQKILEQCDMKLGLNGFKYECVTARAEDFTNSSNSNLSDQPIDQKQIYFVYLDTGSEETHVYCVQNLADEMPMGGVICIAQHLNDDERQDVVKYLQNHNFVAIMENKEPQCAGILLRKGESNQQQQQQQERSGGFHGGAIVTQMNPLPDDRPVRDQVRQMEYTNNLDQNNGIDENPNNLSQDVKLQLRELERQKYDILYNQTDDPEHRTDYGYGTHAKHAYDYILKIPEMGSVLDVGCGRNIFVEWLRSNNISAKGVDLVCPEADILAPAQKIPVGDQSFDYVMSFDMFEHLLEFDVDDTLEEFRRIARQGFFFNICYRESIKSVRGSNLHPTVKPEEWWIAKIEKYGKVTVIPRDTKRYLHCVFN